MKTYIKILILILGFHMEAMQAQNLNKLLKEALENNPGLKASYKEFEAALEKIHQVNALADPNLSFGVFISPVETRVGPQRAKISLSQMFPWFGTLKAKEKVAAIMAETKYQQFLNVKDELFYKVKAAYYPLYEVHQQIRWQNENLEILKTYKKLATAAFSNSKGTLADALRVDLMIDNAEIDIKLLQEQLKPLEKNLYSILNRQTNVTSIAIPDSLSLASIEAGYRKDSLIYSNPKIEIIERNMKAFKAQENVINKQGLPKIGVGLDYVFVGKRSDVNLTDNGKNVFMPMATVSLPVFKKKYKAALKENQLVQESLSYKKEEMTNTLNSSYETAWFELDKARQLFGLYNEQITKNQQVIDLLFIEYSNSGKEFDEILRMQQKLLKYKMAKATAVKKFYVAMAKLDQLTSKFE